MTIQGRIVLPDPWPEGKRRGFPERAIFCREPGLQRGRRRAPFARSREEDAHIKAALWRTEPFHRSDIYHLNTCLMAGALRLPALRYIGFHVHCRAGKRMRTRRARLMQPAWPYSPLNIGGGCRKRRVSHVRYARPSAAQMSPIVSELFSRFSHSTATVSAPTSGRIR